MLFAQRCLDRRRRQTKLTERPSIGRPRDFVAHVSPGAMAKARVSVPVVMISPAASGGFDVSSRKQRHQMTQSRSGPSSTLAPAPRSTTSPLRESSTSKRGARAAMPRPCLRRDAGRHQDTRRACPPAARRRRPRTSSPDNGDCTISKPCAIQSMQPSSAASSMPGFRRLGEPNAISGSIFGSSSATRRTRRRSRQVACTVCSYMSPQIGANTRTRSRSRDW